MGRPRRRKPRRLPKRPADAKPCVEINSGGYIRKQKRDLECVYSESLLSTNECCPLVRTSLVFLYEVDNMLPRFSIKYIHRTAAAENAVAYHGSCHCCHNHDS